MPDDLQQRIDEAHAACGTKPPPGLTLDEAVGWVRALRFIDAYLAPVAEPLVADAEEQR